MTYLPQNQFGYDGLLPAASIVDLLVIASAAFALLLTLMREQRGALIAELDRKGAESESQRQMLRDRLRLDERRRRHRSTTPGSRCTTPPPASCSAGRSPPGSPTRGSEALRAQRTPTAGRSTRPTLRARPVSPTAPSDGRGASRCRVGQRRRRADPRPHPPSRSATSDDRSTMVLLHDVTAQRARLRELSNFAGMVAHDLRGPLTVLDGWLEVAAGRRRPRRTSSLVDDAAAQGPRVEPRMRQVIEDWLNYTVVQNGQLAPGRREAGRGRRARSCDSRRAQLGRAATSPSSSSTSTHSVQADPGLLRQLLDNLVGNAIKYTAARPSSPGCRSPPRDDAEPGWVTRRRHRPRHRDPGGRGGADLRGVPPRRRRRAAPPAPAWASR